MIRRYGPGAFAGLNMVPAQGTALPQAWAPFAAQHPAWLLLPLAALALALALRRATAGGRRTPSTAG